MRAFSRSPVGGSSWRWAARDTLSMRVLAESTGSAFAVMSSFPCREIVRSRTDREVATNSPSDGGVILVSFTSPARSTLLSFFDDEDEEPPTTVRPAHTQQQPRPQPRRPQTGGSGSVDHHSMMVRRRIAAGVGVVLLIVIVLLVNGCLKRGKQQALESYNQNVNQIGQTSVSQTARPLFTTLSGASGKSALDVEVQIDQLRRQAQELAERGKGLSVPSQMTAAQRNLLSALNLRVEGLSKVASLVREALGGQAQQASTKIAGAMEIFLASDVLYSQRVVPLIQQALTAGGVSRQTTAQSRFLPNLGWLVPSTVQSRITGQAAAANGAVAPGTHGHSLKGVSVGA